MDFTGKAIVYQGFTLDSEGSHWILTQEAKAIVGTTYKLVCPKGMETDGASIPRFFWRLMGPKMEPPFYKAAIVHDAGYMDVLQWSYSEDGEWVDEAHTRKEVDELFRELLKNLGMKWWRRSLMYQAVRWFGGKHWADR